MPNPADEISESAKETVLNAKSIAIWPMDDYPLSEAREIGTYFQDLGCRLYPIHDSQERILEERCYRDIRLIPDDYDILLLFTPVEMLPESINALFNADYIPPLVWTHTGIVDLESLERLREANVDVVMGMNLMEMHKRWSGE